MMNNYFHDVATALLATSAFLMLTLLGILHDSGGASSDLLLLEKIYRKITGFALFSLGWIIIGGIPRTIYFRRLEWWDAAGKGVLGALLLKHAVMFLLTAAGIVLWLKVRKAMRDLKNAPRNE